MNVIVTNKQKNIIDNANIDAIKDFNGLFNVDDLIDKLKNYFFSKVILDATSVINFATKEVVSKLASSIGADKMILFLPVGINPPMEFVNLLIDLKIYNFSNDINEIVGYINNPNTYENILAKYSETSKANDIYVDNSIKANEDYVDESVTNTDDYSNVNNQDSNFITTNANGNNAKNINDFTIIDEYNNINDGFGANEVANLVNNDNVHLNSTNNNISDYVNSNNKFITINSNNSTIEYANHDKKIYGIKNITKDAGSTTIVYLLKKYLEDKLDKRVLAVEVNKDDFKYYQTNNMISTSAEKIREVCLNNNFEIILVDLNDYYGNFDFFNDIIYLMEPSLIKLNMLMMENRFIFNDLKNKKVILNKSLLSNNDVSELSKEAGIGFLMNIPPLNDRINNDILKKMVNIFEIQ